MERHISLQLSDEAILPDSPAAVWPVLADVAGYAQWWPGFLFVRLQHATPDLLGTEYTLRPYGWRAFLCRVVSFEYPLRIGLHYDSAYIRGTAEWRLESVAQGTTVVYAMDAVMQDMVVALVGTVIDLQRIHSFSMGCIFRKLRQQVSRTA